MSSRCKTYRPVNTRQSQFEKGRTQIRYLENSIISNQRTKSDLLFADWENKTHDSILRKNEQNQLNYLKSKDREELDERRRRLASQRADEMESWKFEMMNKTETIEQKKERIREKATKLRDEREVARQKYVQDMYEKQFRNSCDAARTLDSKAFLNYVTAQRAEQIEEKKCRIEREKQEDFEYTATIKERVAYLEEQERKRDEIRKQTMALVKESLNAQIKYNAARRMELEMRNAQEDSIELEELRKIIEEEEVKERQRKENMYEYGKQVRSTNEARKNIRQERAEQEKARDLALLKYTIEQENAGKAEEKRKVEVEREAMRQYSMYLREQMIKEAENAGRLDAAQIEAENKMWDKREAEQKARSEARRALMEDVHAARQEQIRMRKESEQFEQIYFAEQMVFDREAYIRAENEELDLARERKQKLLEQSEKLKQQILERKVNKEREFQEEYLQLKRMEAFERAHKKKLDAQAGRVVLNYPLKQSKWYS